MRFEVRNERLYPVQITLQMRQPGASAANSPTEKLTFTPQDCETWLQAKRIARVSAAMVEELDNHLTTTHLNTEQYAVAAYRNLRRNPLRHLLFPHLKEAVSSTAPRPICATHAYAHAANLFYDVLTEYVEYFFDQHMDEITAHWYEVHIFSQDLVQHSAPDFLCRFLQRSVADRPAQARGWFSPEERMDVNVPRFVVNGVPRAVQPVTHSDIALSSDIENMKQVCRYTIYHSTFKHTWANARQYDDGGELAYNGLGLRYGNNGVFAPESDPSIAPPPDRATEQLWISCMLSRSVYGFVMRNEDRDINPVFVDMLDRRRAEFAAVGLDIDTIQSRTNI
jgi:hypothetical protein